MRGIALLLLAACAVTPRAAVRAQAEGRARACFHSPHRPEQINCLRGVEAFCRACGLERDCGFDALYTDRRTR